jgi:hypothetical protein
MENGSSNLGKYGTASHPNYNAHLFLMEESEATEIAAVYYYYPPNISQHSDDCNEGGEDDRAYNHSTCNRNHHYFILYAFDSSVLRREFLVRVDTPSLYH